jgi:hypothetical protein
MSKKFIAKAVFVAVATTFIGVSGCTSSGTPVDGGDADDKDDEATGGRASDDDASGGNKTGGRGNVIGGSAGTGNETGGNGGDGSGGGAGEGNSGAVYGVGTLVFSAEVSNDYLLLEPNLNFGGGELTLNDAVEFSGQADLAAHEGTVLVASGDEPRITKYEVKADLALSEVGSFSFANYGLTSAAFWNNQFVAKDKAYMVNGFSELIIWNPETMEIEGTIDLPELEAREGLRVVAGLADRSSLVYDGKFYLPLYWTDDDYALRSADSVIVVVDIASDSVVSTISANCPGLDYATVDDDGKLYFSNWTGGVGTYYVLDTPQNCIATVDPQSEEVSTQTFASITGGHEGAAFKYAGEGRFVLSVFDEVRADIENAEDPFTPVGGLNWQLWSYEPGSGDAVPIEDVDWNSGAIIHSSIDGQLYSMVPGADYTSTVVYSIAETSAEATFSITGWSFRLFKVR